MAPPSRPSPAAGVPVSATTGRRVPTQKRSRERLARIARAAGELCAEQGADAVTMEAIAARAETSIGSLYQFFPNRDALLHAVAEQYGADLMALLDRNDATPDAADLALEALVDAMLAPFVAFHLEHPGYFAVLFAPQGTDALRLVRSRLRERLLQRAERLFAARAPWVAPAKRRLLALTTVEAARALLQFIEVSLPRADKRPMLEELRAMLVAYLAPWVERRE